MRAPLRSDPSHPAHNFGAGRPLVALLVVGALALCVDAAFAQPPSVDLKRDVGLDQHLNQQVPLDLRFRDEAGRAVRLADYVHDKPVILLLVYYKCPMLCGLELNALARTLRAISFDVGKEFAIVTVSINPREGPELAAAKKKSYLKQYGRDGAETGWHFLTGEESSIRRLAESVGFRYVYDPQKQQYAHAAGLMILTPKGKLSRYFYGVEHSPRDLRLGLVEASQNKIGTPVDQILLCCYQYDPTTGRYGLVIANSLRVGGLLTVFGLGTLVVVLLRRERTQVRKEEG